MTEAEIVARGLPSMDDIIAETNRKFAEVCADLAERIRQIPPISQEQIREMQKKARTKIAKEEANNV